MSENMIYEASIYTRTVSYRNFNGQEQTVELHFALDPIQLMQVIANASVKKTKSNNPAKKDLVEITDAEQLKFIHDLASRAAGFPSDDGESWDSFEGFSDSIAGKAFLTKLTSSDADRQEFAQKVILNPFRAFVGYAKADSGNSPAEIKEFESMLQKMERIFTVTDKNESLEERRARLQAEMAALEVGE